LVANGFAYAQDSLTRQNLPIQYNISYYKEYGFDGEGGNSVYTRLPGYFILNDSNFSMTVSSSYPVKYDTILKTEINDSFNKKYTNLKFSWAHNKNNRFYYNLTDSILYRQSHVTRFEDKTYETKEWYSGSPLLYYPAPLDSFSKRFVCNGVYKYYKDTVNFHLDFSGFRLKRFTTIHYLGKAGYISPGGLYHYDSLNMIVVMDSTWEYPTEVPDSIKDIRKINLDKTTFFFSPSMKKIVYQKTEHIEYHPNPKETNLNYSFSEFLDTTTTTTIPEDEPDFHIGISPNPVTNTTTVAFYNDITETLMYRIYDPWGRVKIEDVLTATLGYNQHVLDLSALPQNQYFIEIFSNDGRSEGHWIMKIAGE
jgi:hypothetical protein